MAYSSPADVRNALAPQANGQPTNTAADLSDSQIADSIAEADSLIDSCIGRYYAVPVQPDSNGQTPTPIRWWSRDVACYLATLTWRRSKDLGDRDPVALRYRDVLTSLYAVRDGKQTLGIPDNAGGASTGAGSPFNPYIGTMFGLDDFSIRPVGPGYPSPHAMPFPF